MSWKQRCLIAASLLSGGIVGAGTLWWATFQSPEFYRAANRQMENPAVRKQAARQFVRQTRRLVDEIQRSESWSQEFTESEINAWLAEEFASHFAEWVPPEVTEPRMQIRDGVVRVGFRYEQPDQWTGVISLEARVWVPAANQLAIRLEGIRAGLVPVPVEAIIEQVTQRAKETGVRLDWSEEDGDPLAIVHLTHGDEGQPKLERVELSRGTIRVTGSSKPENGSFQFAPLRVARQSQPPSGARQN